MKYIACVVLAPSLDNCYVAASKCSTPEEMMHGFNEVQVTTRISDGKRYGPDHLDFLHCDIRWKNPMRFCTIPNGSILKGLCWQFLGRAIERYPVDLTKAHETHGERVGTTLFARLLEKDVDHNFPRETPDFETFSVHLAAQIYLSPPIPYRLVEEIQHPNRIGYSEAVFYTESGERYSVSLSRSILDRLPSVHVGATLPVDAVDWKNGSWIHS